MTQEILPTKYESVRDTNEQTTIKRESWESYTYLNQSEVRAMASTMQDLLRLNNWNRKKT